MKKFFKILLTVIVVIAAAVAIVWGRELKTIASIHQVGENNCLYEMEYTAGYDLDKLVEADIDGNKDLVQYVVGTLTKGIPVNLESKKDEGEHCTSFQVKNADGGWLYGRNYDYYKSPTLVVHSHPKDGYASLAVCDLSHLGYTPEKLPVDFKSKLLSIASVYAPMDGINEKGLCTSIMALPKQAARQNTGKHIAGTSILMRLWLDRCATVDEALDLLETVDVRHDAEAGSGYHYMVADANGDCAVVEFDLFDGWKTMITRKQSDSSYMHVTNHLLAPKYYTTEPDPVLGNPHSKSWWRYDTVKKYLEEHSGVLNVAEAQECLASVHWKDLVWENGMVEDTQYSNVYDQTALTLRLRPWNDYDHTYVFELK